jgi:hypothetical protein
VPRPDDDVVELEVAVPGLLTECRTTRRVAPTYNITHDRRVACVGRAHSAVAQNTECRRPPCLGVAGKFLQVDPGARATPRRADRLRLDLRTPWRLNGCFRELPGGPNLFAEQTLWNQPETSREEPRIPCRASRRFDPEVRDAGGLHKYHEDSPKTLCCRRHADHSFASRSCPRPSRPDRPRIEQTGRARAPDPVPTGGGPILADVDPGRAAQCPRNRWGRLPRRWKRRPYTPKPDPPLSGRRRQASRNYPYANVAATRLPLWRAQRRRRF